MRKTGSEKKKIVSAVLIIICVILAAAFACLWFFRGKDGTISDDGTTESVGENAAYFEYMDSFVCVDSSGLVTDIKSDRPESIPVLTGLSVKSVVVGYDIVCADESSLNYALDIIRILRMNSIGVDEVYISPDGEASVYVNNLVIQLGEDKNTENKLNDLRQFYESVEALDGTLYMQDYSADSIGYSFRYSSDI